MGCSSKNMGGCGGSGRYFPSAARLLPQLPGRAKVNNTAVGQVHAHGVFDKVTDNMEAMKEIHLNSDEQHLFGRAALMVRYEDENKTPVTPEQIITPRRWEDKQNDLWTTWQRVQENMIKGGLSGRSASGKNTRTRAITGIDGDIRINKALWVIAEQFRKWKS